MTTITSDNQYACHDLSLLNERENHNNFAQSKLTLQHIIYHQRRNLLEQAAFWHQVKVKCCLPTLFLHAKLITLIYNLADRRSAIKRQEGGIANSKVCLKALPLSLPSSPNFFALTPNREPVHRLYVTYSKLYKEKKERPQHTIRLKSDIKSVKLQFTNVRSNTRRQCR